jgi:mono/diheme cytochrome c family protein
MGSVRRQEGSAVKMLPLGLVFVGLASAAHALTPAEQRGLTFVSANCGQCHAIGVAGASPLPIAPPFRDLHRKIDVDGLREPLMAGAISEHPSMPHFSLDAAQVNDVIAYMKSLESP